MKVIKNNIVENFLKNNQNKKYSLKKIKRELNISKKYAFFLAMNSKKIKKVKPLDVGSCKNKLSIFQYNNIPDAVCDIKIVNIDDNIIDNNETHDNKENVDDVQNVDNKESEESDIEIIEKTDSDEDIEIIKKE